jgi:hypothetical protein
MRSLSIPPGETGPTWSLFPFLVAYATQVPQMGIRDRILHCFLALRPGIRPTQGHRLSAGAECVRSAPSGAALNYGKSAHDLLLKVNA